MTPDAEWLSKYLWGMCRGQGNALSKHELAIRLAIPERRLFNVAQECRDAGYPVVSTCTGARPGMFYAVNAEEIERTKAELKSRLGAIRRHLDSLERLEAKLDKMPLFAAEGGGR